MVEPHVSTAHIISNFVIICLVILSNGSCLLHPKCAKPNLFGCDLVILIVEFRKSDSSVLFFFKHVKII